MKAFFFCIFLLCVCLCAVRVQSLCCGQVFDGPVYLKDIDASRSHHRVFASWSGFPDPTGKCVVGTSTGKIPALSKLGPSPGLQGITGRARSGTGAFGKKNSLLLVLPIKSPSFLKPWLPLLFVLLALMRQPFLQDAESAQASITPSPILRTGCLQRPKTLTSTCQ